VLEGKDIKRKSCNSCVNLVIGLVYRIVFYLFFDAIGMTGK